jgi:hypothetical protein
MAQKLLARIMMRNLRRHQAALSLKVFLIQCAQRALYLFQISGPDCLVLGWKVPFPAQKQFAEENLVALLLATHSPRPQSTPAPYLVLILSESLHRTWPESWSCAIPQFSGATRAGHRASEEVIERISMSSLSPCFVFASST